jgi:formate dehydrogenase
MMTSPAPDTELLGELSVAMADASICGLGQAASNPLTSVMRHFPEDIATARKHGREIKPARGTK